MPKREAYDDLSFVLYLVPLALSAIYALVLWAQTGLSAILPQAAYLGVTKSPYVFLVGFTAVLLAATLDVTNEEEGPSRKRALFSVSSRLQKLALVSFVLALVAAWYSDGFSGNLSELVLTFLSGRYAMVFPALLMVFSFLILPTLNVQKQQYRGLLAVLCLLGVPAAIYEIGRRSIGLGYGVSALLIVLALVLIVTARQQRGGAVKAAS